MILDDEIEAVAELHRLVRVLLHLGGGIHGLVAAALRLAGVRAPAAGQLLRGDEVLVQIPADAHDPVHVGLHHFLGGEGGGLRARALDHARKDLVADHQGGLAVGEVQNGADGAQAGDVDVGLLLDHVGVAHRPVEGAVTGSGPRERIFLISAYDHELFSGQFVIVREAVGPDAQFVGVVGQVPDVHAGLVEGEIGKSCHVSHSSFLRQTVYLLSPSTMLSGICTGLPKLPNRVRQANSLPSGVVAWPKVRPACIILL